MMSFPVCQVVAVFVGGPKTLRDERGEWRSSIARDRVPGVAELRTGMFARVLAPGAPQAGDQVILEQRPNPGLTIQLLNQCYYHAYRADVANSFLAAEGLMEWWKQRLREKAHESL